MFSSNGNIIEEIEVIEFFSYCMMFRWFKNKILWLIFVSCNIYFYFKFVFIDKVNSTKSYK